MYELKLEKKNGERENSSEWNDVKKITGSLFKNRKEEAIENYALNVIKTINGR